MTTAFEVKWHSFTRHNLRRLKNPQCLCNGVDFGLRSEEKPRGITKTKTTDMECEYFYELDEWGNPIGQDPWIDADTRGYNKTTTGAGNSDINSAGEANPQGGGLGDFSYHTVAATTLSTSTITSHM